MSDDSPAVWPRLLVGAAVGTAALIVALPICIDWHQPKWVFNLPVWIGAAGWAAPFLTMPFERLVLRTRQRRTGEALQRALEPVAHHEGVSLDIVPSGLNRLRVHVRRSGLPTGLRLGSEGFVERGHRIGDPFIDPRVRIEGDEVEAFAALSPAARELFDDLLAKHASLRLADGSVSLTVLVSVRRRGLDGLIKTMANVAHALAVPPGGARKRLVERYRTDPEIGVRGRALDTLLEHYPHSYEMRELADEIIAGDDVGLALKVARACDRPEDVARLEARVEGGRGRLALSAEPGVGGGLTVAEGAPDGALSEAPRPRATEKG